ncbi:MAG: sensor histidine kinase [Thermoplasmatota archaeon]
MRKKKKIDIINKIDKELVAVSSKVIKEAFTNLIENSLIHSEGSKIIIDYHEESKGLNEFINIVIKDDGKGIPDKIKSKVIERGYKGEESTGSGLGIFITDKIMKKYGGSFCIEDSDMGGVKFVVKLKKASKS